MTSTYDSWLDAQVEGPAQMTMQYTVTIWCESDEDETRIATALEQGELWDVAENVQYQIEITGEHLP